MLYNYISRKSTDNKHTACSHMFQPGSAFPKYHNHKDIVKPREKPAKYLGTDPFAALSQMDETAANNDDINNDKEINSDYEANGDQKVNNNEEESNNKDDTNLEKEKLKQVDNNDDLDSSWSPYA